MPNVAPETTFGQEEFIMRQTTMAKPQEVNRQWYIVDATGQTLGRLASEVATVLRGKHKPTFTPNVDCGDFVIRLIKSFIIIIVNFLVDYVKDLLVKCVPNIQLNG